MDILVRWKQKVLGNGWQEKLSIRGNQNYFIIEKLNKLFKDPVPGNNI